jgi:hypothetical protein
MHAILHGGYTCTPGPVTRAGGRSNVPGARGAGRNGSDYFFLVGSGVVGGVLDAPELAPPELLPMPPLAEPAPPEAEPDALPLMPPLAPGAELELLEELPGDVVAPGALGAVLEPVLLEEEVPGRVASLDLPGALLSPQPVAASAIATAAATSVRWVSLCITVSFGVGDVVHRARRARCDTEGSDIV